MRAVVVGILREDGHHVAEAALGSEALHLVDQEYFNVAVVDLQMPGMDGLEVIRRFEDAVNRPGAVIILTSQRDVEMRRRARHLGVKAWLSKPVCPDILRAAVRSTVFSNPAPYGACSSAPPRVFGASVPPPGRLHSIRPPTASQEPQPGGFSSRPPSFGPPAGPPSERPSRPVSERPSFGPSEPPPPMG